MKFVDLHYIKRSDMPKVQYISPEGLQKLKDELKHLKTVRRKEVAARIEAAKALGDLSENAEYSEAKEEQAFVEGRILEISEILQNVEVIKDAKATGYVTVGSKIQVSTGSKEKTFEIVGSNEADPLKGKISNESPLGQAFIGRKVGNKVEITVPAGKMVYTILEIK